jgi:hypothetical protein
MHKFFPVGHQGVEPNLEDFKEMSKIQDCHIYEKNKLKDFGRQKEGQPPKINLGGNQLIQIFIIFQKVEFPSVRVKASSFLIGTLDKKYIIHNDKNQIYDIWDNILTKREYSKSIII